MEKRLDRIWNTGLTGRPGTGSVLAWEHISETEEKDAVEALIFAYEQGINYADLARS